MTIEEWIKQRQARGHDISVIIMDRTTGEGIVTTLDPIVIAALQSAENAKVIQLKEVSGEWFQMFLNHD